MYAKRILPEISNGQDYARVYADTPTWLPAARAICAHHELDAANLRRLALGTHVVFGTGTRIVKLFCRLWEDDFVAERAVLTHLKGLPTPKLIADGELEDWPYLVMTAMSGTPAVSLWSSLGRKEKASILVQLGQMMRKLHEHPPVPELVTDWNSFLRDRIARADEHHAANHQWRSWIRHRIRGFCEPAFDPVLLNADITEEHVLLSEQGGRWKITGLIDFGDAMMGHAYYDFIAPLAFFTFGQPSLSRALLEAYGLELSVDVAERLTTYCLLHEFGRLEDFLKRHPVPNGPAFQRALWGDV